MAKAKKFAAVVGLHNIYEVGTRTIDEERVSYYIIENPQAEDLINHNTICFLTADKQDIENNFEQLKGELDINVQLAASDEQAIFPPSPAATYFLFP